MHGYLGFARGDCQPRNTLGPETELLNYARNQVRTTINDARDAVWNLRHTTESERKLPETLEAITANARRESTSP
jgi:signal transduction histidine kinase